MKLEKGDYIAVCNSNGSEMYRGTIECIKNGWLANIKRDDGIEGSGIYIEGYGRAWLKSITEEKFFKLLRCKNKITELKRKLFENGKI